MGVGLCVTLFVTEFTKVLFWALAWAINYRTAIRLKVALSTLVFENLVSFKTLTRISVGEVSRPAAGLRPERMWARRVSGQSSCLPVPGPAHRALSLRGAGIGEGGASGPLQAGGFGVFSVQLGVGVPSPHRFDRQ